MNEKKLELVKMILESDLPKATREEIVKFYTLPRNTSVVPPIEVDEVEKRREGVGPVKRPTEHDIKRKNNPVMAESEDAVKETLDAKIKGDK